MAGKTGRRKAQGPIPQELFDILACPLCKGNLSYTAGMKGLKCGKCARKYPIKGKIPVLLPPQ